METKDLAGAALLLIAIPLGTLVCCVSQRARDAAFFLMVAGAVWTEKLDLNLLTRYWYRGTTRGFEITFIDVLAMALLVSALLVPRPGQVRAFWPASLGFLLALIFYSACSVAISDPRIYGLFELSKMLRGLVVFLAAAWYVRGPRELQLLAAALACAVCLEGLLALKQRGLDSVYRVTGSLDHPNSLSIYLCMTGPVLVAAAAAGMARPVRWLCYAALGLASVTILLTISRAGIPFFGLVMAGATAFCVSWRPTLKKAGVAALVCLGLAGLLLKSWNTIGERFSQASLGEEYLDEKSDGRGKYLRQAAAILEERPLGVGLNNWSYWVSKAYGAKIGEVYEDYDDLDYVPSKEILASIHYAAPAHNLAALTAGELGLPGLLLFGLLWLRWLHMGQGFFWKRPPDTLHLLGIGLCFGVCGVFLQSLTEWVYRQTQIFLTFHILLGVLASLHRTRRLRVGPARRAMARRENPRPVEEPVAAAGC